MSGLFNSGDSGMLWWIGQIADDSTWRDNTMKGKFKEAETIPGWGMRYKVRIMGIHDQGSTDAAPIPEDQLPWANIVYPVTAGGGQGGSYQTPNLRQGNVVFGFWMDGKDMQTPIIMGVLGNNAQTALGTDIGKAEKSGVTNTSSGSIAKSGFPNNQEVKKKGTSKAKIPQSSLITGKPTTPDIAKESAPAAPGTVLDSLGLDPSRGKTPSILNDIASGRAQAQAAGLTGADSIDKIKSVVQGGIRNRAGAAQSPASPPQPGPTQEHPDNPHHLSAADVVLETKLREKIVAPLKQEDPVGSATKAIQTEIDNLTAKVDKLLGSRKNYIDAVSGPPTQDDIQKAVRDTACKVAKFQKVIMDKVQEYQNKKMNQALTTVVAAMPSSMRAMFGDQKFLNTQNNLEKYNEITNSMCDQMEGILSAKLDVPSLIQRADAVALSGALWADPNSQAAVSGLLDLSIGGSQGAGSGVGGGGSDVMSVDNPAVSSVADVRTPRVPICYAEDVVAQGIAVNKDKLAKIANDQHKNYNRFLKDVKSQLEKTDKELGANAYDMSENGKVLNISDEEANDLPIGGTNYYTETGVPTTGGSGTGLMVDIVVPDGGWYDNGFATLNEGGAGYTVNTADSGGVSGTGTTEGATTTGGSGTGIKVNYTISSGVITGITTNTGGANYKNGDVLTIVNNASGTPSTNATFTVDKVRGVVNRIKNGGIKINKPGIGYKMGDVLIVNQQGSGMNCGTIVIQVMDPGEKKATAGPVTPGDLAGSLGKWIPPRPPSKPPVNAGQNLGDMLQMLGGMSGSMTQALDFKNIMGNIFPFETPPNMAVSDFYTLARGGAGQPETETPTADVIDKAIPAVTDVAAAIPSIPFAGPGPDKGDIQLLADKVSSVSDTGQAAIDAQRDVLDLY